MLKITKQYSIFGYVSFVPVYWTRSSNPGRGKGFSCPPIFWDRLWGLHSLLFSAYRVSFKGAKGPGREFNHSSPYSAEVHNKWGYTSTPPIYLHVVEREKFNFTFSFHLQIMIGIFVKQVLCTSVYLLALLSY
jgi:hypothetical protein